MWVECPECYNFFNISEQLSSYYILTEIRFWFLILFVFAVGVYMGWAIRHYAYTGKE